MTSKKRFLLGGGGALMPVLVSLLAIDIGAVLNDGSNLTTGNIIGIVIRYLILFVLGGIVAYLHEDEHKPFKIFELGIAAPALITSLITAQGISVNNQTGGGEPLLSFQWSIIRSAQADTVVQQNQPVRVAWGIKEVFDGVTGRAYQKIARPVKKTTEPKAASQTGKVKAPAPPVVRPSMQQKTLDRKVLQARTAKLKAKVARLKARALQKKYQASLAEAQAAEAIAESNELELELMRSR